VVGDLSGPQVGAGGDAELVGPAEPPRGIEGLVRVAPSAECRLVEAQLDGQGGQDAGAASGIALADPVQLPLEQRDEASVDLPPFA
jgi:hypothetical protein